MATDTRAAVELLLRPTSLVIVGASANPESPSGRPLAILRQHDYPGEIHLVNPAREEIAGIRCHRSVADLPTVPDMALVVVAAHAVPQALRECRDLGIRAAYVISAGFGEAREGTVDPELLAELDALLAERRIRVAGPNAEGIYNVVDDIALGFSPCVDYTRGLRERPVPGTVAVVAQSGGLGFGILNQGLARDLRFSYVITVGNELDIDVLDYVDVLVADDVTKVIVLFLEGVPAPLRLEELALRAHAKGKTIVAAKVGRHPESRAAAVSHTGHLTGPSTLYSALFARCGIVEVHDLDELVDSVAALAAYDGAAGPGVGIVTRSGGTATWLTDVCRDAGLQVPELSEQTRDAVMARLPYFASARNPVDVTAAELSADDFVETLLEVGRSPDVDTLVLVYSMVVESTALSRAESLGRALSRPTKPLLVYSYTVPTRAAGAALAAHGIPWFTSQRGVAAAARALATRSAAARRLAAPGEVDRIRRSRLAAGLADPFPAGGGASVPEHQVKAWLRANGVAVPDGVVVASADAAVAAARSLGHPVALKVQSPDLPHKADAGVLALGLSGDEAVAAAYRRITAAAGAAEVDGVLVERMAPPGRELLVGVTTDDELGAFLTLGAGGGAAEVQHDVVTLPAPCTAIEVRAGLARLACWPLLAGHDVAALTALAVAVSELGHAARGRLRELDLNPVLVHADGVSTVDGLATLVVPAVTPEHVG